MRCRTFKQLSFNFLDLSGIEPWLTTCATRSLKPFSSLGLPDMVPLTYSFTANAKHPGYVGLPFALPKEACGLQPSRFQGTKVTAGLIVCGIHTSIIPQNLEIVKILCEIQ
jgi:hypothetical protein